jgi:glycosyltransferase involved in cell wall biosynthesis
MKVRPPRVTIIIPTKNRAEILPQLLESIAQAENVELCREVIVADNNSHDNTCAIVDAAAKDFSTELRVLKVSRPGKSAALNEAVKSATGELLAFLDDDVIVDKAWLTALDSFFHNGEYQAGQGMIRLQLPDGGDPEIIKLVQRYRTIPSLEHDPDVKRLHSLNGANFFVLREAFERVGGFDERLGPGASGTSEDVDFARRLTRAQIAIGYTPQAIVYHRVDRERLTEEYFKAAHRRQGASRFLIRKHSVTAIVLNLARSVLQYGYYTMRGTERDRYRSKGRIYHYLGMIEAKQNHSDSRQAGKTENAIDSPSLPV